MVERMSRRKLILGGAAVAAAGAAGIAVLRTGEDKKSDDRKRESPKAPESRAEMVDVPNSLRGRMFGDLFIHYTSIAGQVPNQVRGDFPTQQLPKLWELKEKKYGETAAVAQTRRELVGSYDQKKAEKMGWREYRDRGQASVTELRRALDWNAVGNHFGLADIDLRLMREFEGQINGSALISYALTELMPGTDGALNREVLDFLLRIGGREYVERIPAVNDAKVSMGSYQFTEYALFDTGKEKRGASRVSQYLPAHLRLPGSVGKMRGDDHHKAAYLFALCNLALLVKGIDEKDEKALLGRSTELRAPLVEFIATAHNLPAVAIKDFRKFLTAFLGRDPRPKPRAPRVKKGQPQKEPTPLPPIKLGHEADYLQHTRGGGLVWNYARKTRANYRVISNS